MRMRAVTRSPTRQNALPPVAIATRNKANAGRKQVETLNQASKNQIMHIPRENPFLIIEQANRYDAVQL